MSSGFSWTAVVTTDIVSYFYVHWKWNNMPRYSVSEKT